MTHSAIKTKQFVFEDDRPFASCHASTLIVLDNGDVLTAWFGGSKEGADDIAIWAASCRDGQWNAPVKVADEADLPHWNPVLFEDGAGKVLLYYKVGKKIRTWVTRVIESLDGGQTWSEPRVLVEGDVGGRGPVKNKPIVLSDGTWAAPASIEEEKWLGFVDLSTDKGASWQQSNVIDFAPETQPAPEETDLGKGLIQPSLWESEPGKVHMLLRSSAGWVFRSDSADGGKSWTDAYATSLPNNNSGLDLVKMDNGTLALVYNPVRKNWGARTPLVLSFSDDNGATWKGDIVLEDEPGEYSYPAIVARGNELHITYTWKRERVAYWKVTL